MKRKSFLYIIILIFSILFIIAGCSKGEAEPIAVVDQTAPATVKEVPKIFCPLTGMEVATQEEADKRPIAVMIDNEYNARPQSGLLGADIVYEMPVEGNITRYMAIYHHLAEDKIGPVRSARPYFIDTALEYNAVYVHCGGSPQALKDLATLKVETLNDLKGSPCFWRGKDRKMPHNLYTSVDAMRKVIQDNKYKSLKAPTYFKFADETLDLNGMIANGISINYFKNYKISYKYDLNTKLYTRMVNGAPLKDKESGTEIKATNIIIQKISGLKVLDDKGRLEIGNIGSNSGYYISNGKSIDIKWKKDSRRAKTIYTDIQGNEITLNRGNTWVQVVSEATTIEIKE